MESQYWNADEENGIKSYFAKALQSNQRQSGSVAIKC